MGIFDKLLDIRIACPSCGAPRAKVTLLGVKCVNPACRSYDSALAAGEPGAPVPTAPIDATPVAAPPAPTSFARPIVLTYTNHRGEGKKFTGDAGTLRDRGLFLSICVAPEGTRVSLRKTKIANLSEVQATMQSGPRPSNREAHVLHYHTRRGTTSALFESLRAKYPGW